eukprot:399884-Amorphochlora_amoeboformis.AAC.1
MCTATPLARQTRGYLGWVLWVDCVTWRDVTLYHVSSKFSYYRVLPDTTVYYRIDDLQESPEFCDLELS